MQAIHLAALGGHSAVVNVLIKRYNVNPNVPVSSIWLCEVLINFVYV